MNRSLATLALLLMLAVVPASASDDAHHSSAGESQEIQATDSETTGEELEHHEMSDSAAVVEHGEELSHEMAVGHEGEVHSEEHAEESGVMGILAHHLLDSENYDIFGYSIHLPVIPGDFSWLDPKYVDGFQITKHMLGLAIAAFLVIVLVMPTTKRTKRGEVPSGFGNFLELLVVFVRDEVVYANMGPKHGRKWLPFFLTLFFLILFSNLLGMIPWGVSATGNVNVTAGLAIASLLGVFVAGIVAHGFKYIGTFIPHGVPMPIWPILFPIEVFGLFVKHFALTIRLFANMLAGHTVIGVFLALIATPLIALVAVPGAAVISILELFVAFLQAYVFVMLGSLFVGSAIEAH